MKAQLEVEATRVDTDDPGAGFTWTLWCGRAKIAQVWGHYDATAEVMVPRVMDEAARLGREL